jgi:hypothetical protein
MTALTNFLNSRKTIAALFIINFFSALIAFYMANSGTFMDAKDYWFIAEGLTKGKFTSWYFLDTYYPETLRTPGYPLFLFLVKSVWNAEILVKLIQLGLYYCSLLLAYKLVRKLSGSNNVPAVVFLFLTAVNIQIPFYSGYISPETICIFLTISFMYILIVKERNFKNAVVLGLIAGLLFSMRPAFLLFPVLLTSYILFFNRKSAKFALIQLSVFGLTLLPFAAWNYTHHGVFKPTPLEGGAGVANIGYWSFKLPVGYTERFYWNSTVTPDWTNPVHMPEAEREANRIRFEAEWLQLLASQRNLLSQEDSQNIKLMKSDKNPGIFILYNSQYTLAREKNLWNGLMQHIREEPLFYLKTRVYSFFRVYFTGINTRDLAENPSVSGKLKTLYPFAVTFTCILLGLMLSLIYFVLKRKKMENGLKLLLLISLYQGLVHIPFAIQARYTVPVHFCILIMVSIILPRLFKKRDITVAPAV